MKCETCKYFGEKIDGRFEDHKCNLHGCEICAYSCGCWWHNQDTKLPGGINRFGDIPNTEEITYWHGNHFLRVAVRVGCYGGRWYAAEDFNLPNWGAHSHPNIHQTSYETREAAIEQCLRYGLTNAERFQYDDDALIFRDALMEYRQLSLF